MQNANFLAFGKTPLCTLTECLLCLLGVLPCGIASGQNMYFTLALLASQSNYEDQVSQCMDHIQQMILVSHCLLLVIVSVMASSFPADCCTQRLQKHLHICLHKSSAWTRRSNLAQHVIHYLQSQYILFSVFSLKLHLISVGLSLFQESGTVQNQHSTRVV